MIYKGVKKVDIITVIVPIYNSEVTLKKCLESIMNQTYKKLEIITILDGCTDNCLDIINEYKNVDERICILNRENRGILYTRLEGIKKASGKYIIFVDSDDWINNNMIENMYNWAKKYDADITRCTNYFENENKIITNYREKYDFEFILKENFNEKIYPTMFSSYDLTSIWNQLIKKEKVCDILDIENINISYGDDMVLNISLYKSIENILLIPETYYHYRINDKYESITKAKSYDKLNKNLWSCYRAYIELFKYSIYVNLDEEYASIIILRMHKAITNRIIELLKTNNKSESYATISKIFADDFMLMAKDKINKGDLKNIKVRDKIIVNFISKNKIRLLILYLNEVYIPSRNIKKILSKKLKWG